MKWGLRALLALSGGLAVATLLVAVSASRDTVSGEALDGGTVTAPVRPDRETILWSADFETRDFAPWEAGGGGGIFNTGTGVASITSEVAHGGRHAAKLTISQASGTPQAVRIFRWAESERETEAYYSVWLYFPRRYEPAVWWNVIQFKSKT
ncbi:MAG TPA: hypothetical protein VER55_13025, partial [Ardenticatenaceae bacterium]|nr:hypothetical protein [Ardenticatenaceae bacterium]